MNMYDDIAHIIKAGMEKAALRHEIETLKTQRDELLAASQWRPIETAPKDGTDVLCFCVEPEFAEEGNPHKEFRVCFYGQLQPDYFCWMSHYGYEQRPTHWQPLPNPPSPTL